ncbi:MAG: Bug family tripartite tricarboxylate transporter substrate binding protein [Rhodospirillaceae bacterium]
MRQTRVLVLFAALALCGSAAAQQFPTKPVRIIVPFPAGGSFDVVARILAQRMQLGQSVIVENRPGGGTVIGTEYVAHQPGDGHTLLSIGPSFTMHHAVRSKVPFDTAKDFKAVAEAMALTMVVAVHPTVPARTMQEYIALARARPGQLSYGTSGPGTSHNMLGEALKLAHKVNIVHAPFQGEAPAVTAAVGGHVSGVLVNLFSVAPFAKAGRLRALAVTSPERDPIMPDVPTAREAGVAEIEAMNWNGYVVPSATPGTVIARLNAEINKVLSMAEVRDFMRSQGMIATPVTPEQFAALLKSDGERYGRIAREANVRLD